MHVAKALSSIFYTTYSKGEGKGKGEDKGKGEGEGKVPGLTWDGNMKGHELSIEGVASLKFREQSDEGEFEGAGDDLGSAMSLCMILLPMCAALAP